MLEVLGPEKKIKTEKTWRETQSETLTLVRRKRILIQGIKIVKLSIIERNVKLEVLGQEVTIKEERKRNRKRTEDKEISWSQNEKVVLVLVVFLDIVVSVVVFRNFVWNQTRTT